jgi:hypothetical protein
MVENELRKADSAVYMAFWINLSEILKDLMKVLFYVFLQE